MTAFQLGVLIDRGNLRTTLGEPGQQLFTDLGMCHFSAAEANCDLQPVAVFQKLLSVFQLYVEIVFADAGRHTDFLDLHNVLVAASFLFPLELLEAVLAVIHDLADGRLGTRRDHDKIQTFLHRDLQRRFGTHNAELFALVADESDLLFINFFIDLMSRVTDRKTPPKSFAEFSAQKNGRQPASAQKAPEDEAPEVTQCSTAAHKGWPGEDG